jgi:flagellar motor switch protein FliN/FliY
MEKYPFIEHVQQALLDVINFPKSYKTLDVPLKEIEEMLKKRLDLKEIQIDFKETKIESNNLFLEASHCVELSTPLDGVLLFSLSNDDITTLIEIFSKQVVEIVDPYLAKSLFYFLALEIIKTLKEVAFLPHLELKISEVGTLPNAPLFSNFIDCKVGKKQLSFRISYTKSFAKSFDTYINPQLHTSLPKGLDKIDTYLHMQVGSTELDFEAFKTIKKGDFVLLDRCTIDPETHHGTLNLALNSTPLMIAKLKENQLKILDLVKIAGEEMIDDQEMNQEDESWLEENKEGVAAAASIEKGKEKLIKPSDIPLTLTAEVGRLKLSVKELLELAPNTTLDLKINLDEGVDLMIGNKKVAKGELVKLGNFLGVRITEIKR